MFFSRSTALLLTSYLLASSSVLAAPIAHQHQRREVPQEHSHEKYLTSVRTNLNINNPDGILDPVFGLLGNAAAANGQGKIADPDCLHLATADRAFTNAKAAGDVQGQVDALIFAALERNTGKVGLASVICTSIQPVNPEIGAFTQIQDPASAGAAEGNKKTILALAVEISKLGGDPLQALDASTFKPGDVNDATGKGNTCDDANDPEGCIFTQNLIDIQVTEAEITAAVGGTGGGDAVVDDTPTATEDCSATVTVTQTITAAAEATAAAETEDCPAPSTVTVTVKAGGDTAPTAAATTAAAAATTAAAATGGNLQTFTGALGGVTAPAVTNIGGNRPFSVANNAAFDSLRNALQRSCDVQHNQCANASNGAGNNKTFSVQDCTNQQDECGKVAQAAARR